MPGRVCLVGEHSDWAAISDYNKTSGLNATGLALICPTDQGIHISARMSPPSSITDDAILLQHLDFTYTTTSRQDCLLQFNFHHIVITPISELLDKIEPQDRQFVMYIVGVLKQLFSNQTIMSKIEKTGQSLICHNYNTTLPMGKGVSSSAAISVLITRIFNTCYQLGLSIEEEINIAFQGERSIGSECGKLDHGCAYGDVAVCLSMRFNIDSSVTVEKFIKRKEVAIQEGAKIYMLLIDLNAKKDTIKILKDLNKAFTKENSEVNDDLFQNARNYLLRENHDICERALQFVEEKNAQALGQLLSHAQNEFDKNLQPLCPEELTAPILHSVLNDTLVQTLIFGGKGVGSGGDGSCIVCCKGFEERELLKNHLESTCNMPCLYLTL